MIVVSARSYDAEVGGNSRYIREVAERLRLRGLSLTFASPPRKSNLGWAFFEAARLQKLAKRSSAAAVWYPMDTGPVRASNGIHTILTLHGAGVLHDSTLRHPVMGSLWRTRARAAARAADLVITVSHASAEDIVQLAGERVASRLEVIPHGVGLEWFDSPSPDTRYSLSREIDLDCPFAFYYGNIEPRKNLALAVAALELVRETYPEFQFIVSGAPAWQSQPILDELTSRSWIHYLGRRSDDEIRALLAACQFFIFPSRYEGFGLPVLEALAAGTPVVTSTRGALPEVAGTAAFLSNELDASEFASACIKAITADRKDVARASIAQASKFSWDTSADRHLEVIRAL